MVFVPVSRGIVTDQFVVPAAGPDIPNPLDQLTDCTPTLSEAVPVMAIDVAVVEMVELEGERIVSVGAVVSGDPGGGGGADVRVTVMDVETWAVPDVAVTVIVLVPNSSGTLATLHAEAAPAAVPDAPDVADHETEIVVEPPVAEPDKPILARFVLRGGAFTVSVSGAGRGGGGGGGGGVVSCTAYSVSTALLSPAARPVTIL
jgi:hypothetical protein